MNTETTRRAFIVGTAAVAAAASVPAAAIAPPADRRVWDYAMARYKRAEQIAEAYDAGTFNPLYEQECAFEEAHGCTDWTQPGYHERRAALYERFGNYRVPEAINDEHDRLWEVAASAQWELMETPAPDQGALRWKLEVLLEDAEQSAERWALADIARLLPQGR